MRTCVAGGAGYIGSHIVSLLVKESEVVVLDNLSTGHRSSIHKDALFVHGDVADMDACSKALKGCQSAIYLAALKAPGESMTNPTKYANANIINALKFFESCINENIKYIIFSSTAAIYGAPQYLPIDEKHPTSPENFYGYTKLQIEDTLRWYSKLKDIKYACLRYFNAAGYDPNGEINGLEKSPANLIPIVMETACGLRKDISVFGNDYPTKDGTCIRDYIHVTDLAYAHILALRTLSSGRESFCANLGTGQGYSVLDVIRMAQRITGKEINYKFTSRRAGDPAEVWASNDFAKSILKWHPVHSSLEELIKTTWEAYKRNTHPPCIF